MRFRFLPLFLFACLLAGAVQADDLPDLDTADPTGIQVFAENGGDLDMALDGFGHTALIRAAMRGDVAMVGALLDAGASVDLKDYRGASALSLAVRSCRVDRQLVETLVEAGADLENRSGAAMTPLLVAIQNDRPDIAAQLIEYGADIDATNSYGDGVLNFAIYYRMPQIIGLALDHAVDTGQLKLLYVNDVYYYPNFGQVRPQANSDVCLHSS